jgi:hypothetical protein
VTAPKNANERLMTRINAAIKSGVHDEDERVLTYIKKQITPAAIEKRAQALAGSSDVSHLHEVANQRLRAYEKESTTQ